MGFAVDFKQKNDSFLKKKILFKHKYKLDFITILLSWNNVSVPPPHLFCITYKQNKGNTFFLDMW